MNPAVSVVIPTHSRPQLLQRCLEALVAQDFDPAAYEIVVIDDAHSEATRRQIESFARRHGGGREIRYRRPPPGTRGPAAARNAGWLAARSEIVAFTDDDTIPTPNWLSVGVAAMRPGVAAAWGDVVVPLPEHPTDAERNTAGLDGAEFVTANCFVRRTALAMTGGFDERFTRPWREDSDLYFTLLENSWTVVSAPAAIVVHPARTAPPGTCLKQHKNLFYDALLYKKHPRLYREKISAAPPLRYYFAVAALLTAAIALFTGHTLLAEMAAAAWLGLSLFIAARRLEGTSPAWRDRAEVAMTSFAIPFLAVYWRLAGALHFRVLFA